MKDRERKMEVEKRYKRKVEIERKGDRERREKKDKMKGGRREK
jgi:hypothetical protein